MGISSGRAIAVAIVLFLIWSNSFIANSFLLGGDGASPRLDWRSLALARFVVAGGLVALYCALWRGREALALLARFPLRWVLCSALGVPVYNLALGFAQQQGVPAPIASLVTTVAPLLLLVLGVLVFSEALTLPKIVGFLIAAAGMAILGWAGHAPLAALPYPGLLAVAVIAPLSWSVYSVLAKPVAAEGALLWSYLTIAGGTLLMAPWMPAESWRQFAELDGAGWAAVLYLSVPCTVAGFALWNWLLGRLPASVVGLTVFLNPPLTTLSKALLAWGWPETFSFSIAGGEWIGGAITLAGVAVAVTLGREGRPSRTEGRATTLGSTR